MIGGWNLFSVSLGTKIHILKSIGWQIIFNSHWFLKDEKVINWRDFFNSHGTKRTSGRRGFEKLGGEEFLVTSSYVIFLGKGRKGMRSIGKWWKGGKWVECFGVLKKNRNKYYSVSVTTLALGLQPRQRLVRVWAKKEAQESHFMLPRVQKSVRE